MRIQVLTPFKHGRDAFHAGDVRTVSDEDGAYFAAHGWARRAEEAGNPVPAVASQPPVNLEVQNLVLNQGVQHA